MDDMNKRTAQYVQVRDALKRLAEEYDAKKKPLQDLLDRLEGKISSFLDANGVDSIKTESGTAYRSTRYSASLADPDAFMRYVVDNQQFDLLDRRANVTAVKAFVKKNNALPPGVNMSATQTLGVRRGGAKEKDE